MNFRLTIKLVFLVSSPFFGLPDSFSQLPNTKKLSQFVIKNYSTEQGLPSNAILRLKQTADGFLWIGTYDGLARFDGTEFKIFDQRNLPDLKSHSISDILTVNGNDLLLGTHGKGAYLFKNGQAKLLHPQLANTYVTCLALASNSDIWIGTNNQGIVIVTKSGIRKIAIDHSGDLRFKKIIEISPNEFWASTETTGIIIIKNGVEKEHINEADGLLGNNVFDLVKDKHQVYVGSQNGLNVIDIQTKSILTLHELNGFSINKIVIDSLHNLWLGTVRGLFRRQANGVLEIIGEETGLTDDLWDILFDQEGTVWFATYRGGLYQLCDGKFTNLNSGDGLSSSSVRTIFEWRKGKYLVGMENGDVNIVQSDGAISRFPIKQHALTSIYDIKEDHDGNLWIASYGGLLKIDKLGNEKYFSPATGFPFSLLRCLLIDTDNRLWIGTRDKGVVVMKNDKIVTSYSTANALSSNLIMCIQQDAKGDVWVGTNSTGFYIFKKGASPIRHYSSNDGMQTNVVFNISFDKTDPRKTWIATNQGIALLFKDKLISLSGNSGIPENSSFDILEDDFGYFWIPTAKGVLRVKKYELIEGSTDSTKRVNWKLFATQDGIKSPECLGAAKSLIASNKELWIPMTNGLISINPNKIKKNLKAPAVFINTVQLDGHTLDSAFNNLSLESGLQRLTIRYSGISYYFNEAVRYKVMLEPYDKTWLDMQNKREVVYTNLPQGKYTFKVKACNADEVWSDEAGTSFQFMIKPHFYQTFYFYFIVSFLSLVAVVALVKFRTYRISTRNKSLQRLIDVKTSELQRNLDDLKRAQVQLVQSEKMASLGLLTAGIAHEINNPINFISVGIEALGRLQKQLNRYFIQLLNNEQVSPEKIFEAQGKVLLLIDDIKIGTTRTEEIVSSLRTFSRVNEAEYKLADINHGIECTLVLLNSRLKNRIEVIKYLDSKLPHVLCYPGQLNQVFMNLLSNAIDAIKGPGVITITTYRADNHIEIRFADTGCGIPKNVQEKIFEPFFTTKDVGVGTGLGLSISYGIIKQHKGSITVSSEEGKGTKFSIRLPVDLQNDGAGSSGSSIV